MGSASPSQFDVPAFLDRVFSVHSCRQTDINNLFVCLWLRESTAKAYVPVVETPHYAFVREVLVGESLWPVRGYHSYSQYIGLHPHPRTDEGFIELIESFRATGYDAQTRPVLVFRSWRRPWPLTRWDVADGFHRLAILAAMGEQHIHVATLKPKRGILHRLMEKVLYES
jgi:hypothetical protein